MRIFSFLSSSLSHIAPLLVTILIWLLMVFSSFSAKIDNNMSDVLAGLSTPSLSDKITIIGIDAKSLDKMGSWPWPREYHAKLLDRLKPAKVVGLDLILSEPTVRTPETDQMLAQSMKNNGKVVMPLLPEIMNNHLVEVKPLSIFLDEIKGVGHIDTVQDADGVVRRLFLKAGIGFPQWSSFSEVIFRVSESKEEANYTTLSNVKDQTTWYRDDEVLIPFPQNYKVISYVDVLNGEHKDQIKDSIVLIGAIAPGLGDTHVTPSSPSMPGVVVVASQVNAFLTNGFIDVIPDHWLLLIGIIILIVFDTFIVRFTKKNSSGMFFYLLCSLILLSISVGAFFIKNIWLPFLSISLLLLILGFMRLSIKHVYFKNQALNDGLTGLTNRRHFDELFEQYFENARTSSKPFVLMIIDIDFFKGFNDTYGHSAGDDVLRRIGATLMAMLQHSKDVAARVGGEEFGILLPNTQEAEGVQQAEKIREAICDLGILHMVNPHKVVTCSIGVVACDCKNFEISSAVLYELADLALYHAKQNGRNLVSFSKPKLN